MRTRFAPSPTGLLHIGGLRTALFAWLAAKKDKGTFFLRIEDTDKAREMSGATENFVRTLTWAGLKPDEGVLLDDTGKIVERGEDGPYFQSKRLDLYRLHVDRLLQDGHAYPCFCTAERLDEMRKSQQARKLAPMYDRLCLSLSKDETDKRIAAGEKHVIRMKVPHEQKIVVDDAIYGHLEFKGHTVDDQVLLKSDGFPTYHLAHVVDDHLMKTDLVIRGEEWVSSVPKHILLFGFFGWQAPGYAHVPLLLNKDRSKLSKRQNDVSADDYINKGYLPEALINFLALLGWNPGTEQEIFSLPELVEAFSIDRIHKSGAIFDLQKLDWLQGQWIRRFPIDELAEKIRPLVTLKYPAAEHDLAFARKVDLVRERMMFFPDAPEMLSFFYEEPATTEELLISEKQGVTKDLLPAVKRMLIDTLTAIPEAEWKLEALKDRLLAKIKEAGLKNGQVLWPMRVWLTGKQFSPGAFEVAAALGRETALRRINA